MSRNNQRLQGRIRLPLLLILVLLLGLGVLGTAAQSAEETPDPNATEEPVTPVQLEMIKPASFIKAATAPRLVWPVRSILSLRMHLHNSPVISFSSMVPVITAV